MKLAYANAKLNTHKIVRYGSRSFTKSPAIVRSLKCRAFASSISDNYNPICIHKKAPSPSGPNSAPRLCPAFPQNRRN